MKLSSKGRYAVRALFDLAYFSAEAPMQIKDIASRQGIPARFLEQIFQELKRAGLVVSKRGPRGGYHLARAADAITLGDIVRAVEGPIGARLGEAAPRRASARDARRAADEVFRDLATDIEACFDRVSVADVVRKAEALGVRRNQGQAYVYAI